MIRRSIMKFFDGLVSLISDITNTRQAVNTNTIVAAKLAATELREIYKTGLGSKIVRIKNGYALKTPLIFKDPLDKKRFEKKLLPAIKKAGGFMIGFGRSIIVINSSGDDLSKPLTTPPKNYKLDVFSGDMVTAVDVSLDLADERYNKPKYYIVRGHRFHHTRIIDFRYVEPPEFDLPVYNYGGMSEFELIYNQLVNDGVIERACPAIIEKGSTLFYKIKGFKNLLASKQEKDVLNFFSATERARSAFGAGLIDAEDDVVNITQQFANLDSVDQISLRRLAMVTGIPLAVLVGESVRGLNSTGEKEKQLFDELIETIQGDYYLPPINELLEKLGLQPVEFSKIQNATPNEKMDYETKAIENAKKLWEMGEDFGGYLEERGVIEPDNFAEFFENENL